MPLALVLPTTSRLQLDEFFASSSHPSLPFTATIHRDGLRNALKRHKSLPSSSQALHLQDVLTATNDYLPYLLTIQSAIKKNEVNRENVVIDELQVFKSVWRAPLTAGLSTRISPKINLSGFEFEVIYVVSVQAAAYYLQARAQLHRLYKDKQLTNDQRVASIKAAVNFFLEANAVYNWLYQYTGQNPYSSSIPDVSQSTFAALAQLALANATMTTILKDDPYPFIVAQTRNEQDKEWMVKPPELPRVRAHLISRLCLASADHAQMGQASLSAQTSRLTELLPEYLSNMRSTARAKACRFLGIDAELSGCVGQSIAWLQAAKKEVSFDRVEDEGGGKSSGIQKWKAMRAEKKEARKILKEGAWGSDAGKFEENRIIDMLMDKYIKLNNTVSFEPVLSIEEVMRNLPSGRDIHNSKALSLPLLDSSTLVRLRGPPDLSARGFEQDEDVSSEDEEVQVASQYY